MPHQCTACRRVLPDGSQTMLSGCPDCGGKKFQFIPADRDEHPSSRETDSNPREIIQAPVDETAEDHAQATARRTIVTDEELPKEEPLANKTSHTESDEADPDLEEIKGKLNEQFESIRILNPGEYELNLVELFDRDEYIVALEEDGRYVIDMPSKPRDS